MMTHNNHPTSSQTLGTSQDLVSQLILPFLQNSPRSIYNFSHACRSLYQIIANNNIWLEILCDRFDELNPSLVHDYHSKKTELPFSNVENQKKNGHFTPTLMTLYFRMNYYSTHLDELPDSFYEKSTMSMQQQASRPILLAAASSGGFPYAEEFGNHLIFQYFSEQYDLGPPNYVHGERKISNGQILEQCGMKQWMNDSKDLRNLFDKSLEKKQSFAYSIAVQTSGHWEQDKKVVQFVRDYIKKKFKLRTFHLVLCDLNAKDQVEAVVIDTLKLAQKFQVDMMNRLFIYLSNDEKNHIKPLNHSKSCLTM